MMGRNCLLASCARSFLLRLLACVTVVLLFTMLARAGGPKYVAGSGTFDASVTGQPVLWPGGQITYFTDQGDLSPVLPNASADSFVAGAFSQWTSIATAAISATSGGQLAEDVSGTNVTLNADGSISMPLDIEPTATGTPLGVVYDADGSVTDAFLGSGAGDSSQCFSNAVFGGVDNFGEFATIQHALIVINGQCAQQSSQLTDVEYRLVRVFGEVLGIGWSQLNLNAVTGVPHATADDFAGLPVMHYTDPQNCVPITLCYASPYQMSADDIASVSRLYPVTSQNESSFPGKNVFAKTTARVHGSIWFTNTAGQPTQAMQGVNVVARWIDPLTGQPSHRYSVSSVSGFPFTGNAGNSITGFLDSLGNPYSEWGSSQASAEGFYDLAGLPFPNSASSGQYQLTVEAIDPLWSEGVRPYGPYQVAPSGSMQPIVVSVSPGVDIPQDILMTSSAQPVPGWAASTTWTNPAPVPSSGDWVGSLSGYGASPYFTFAAQSNRTLSIAVTALDELGNATESKAQPVIGIWSAGDPQGAPPPSFTPSPFNSQAFGLTRLDAQALSPANFILGIADLRGDGRPDYRYHAHLLYADSVSPPRVSAGGGTLTLRGIGFSQGQNVLMGQTSLTPLSLSGGEMILTVPPTSDGAQTITVTDPISGAASQMTSALTIGAASTDRIVMVSGTNPSVPAGTQAPNAIRVQVLASDGVTPVSGATVAWSTSNGVTLSACGGASACSVVSDEGGFAWTYVTPASSGTSNVTATLAPASYSSAKYVTAVLSATSSSLDIGAVSQYPYVAQGAALSVPLTTRVVSHGLPQSGAMVNYQIQNGSGSLSAVSAVTNSGGYATVSLSVTNATGIVQISACVAPGNTPCTVFGVSSIAQSQLQLQAVSGSSQAVSTGSPFAPIVVRVTDSANPPNFVMGASVTFQTVVLRSAGPGEASNPVNPVVLSATQSAVSSDINGLASILPSTGSFGGQLDVDVIASMGAWNLDYSLMTVPPAAVAGGARIPSALQPKAGMR